MAKKLQYYAVPLTVDGILLDHLREKKRVSKDAIGSSGPGDLLHHHTVWILKNTHKKVVSLIN